MIDQQNEPLHSVSFPTRRTVLGMGASVLAGLALGESLAAEEAPKEGELRLAWYGQSMFQLVTPKGTKILIDPQDIEAHRVPYVSGDLLLMTHFHTDHTTTPKVENIKTIKQFNALKRTGPGPLDHDWNAVDEKMADFRYQSFPTFHDDAKGAKRGKNGCWIIDVAGVRIVHLGDLGHLLTDRQLRKLGTVDILMVPCGGVYTIHGLDAFKVFEQIKPRRCCIPMHHGTVVYDELLPLTYFTDECKDNDVPIDTLKPKEWLKIDTRAPAPKKPRVVAMHYFGPGGRDTPAKNDG